MKDLVTGMVIIGATHEKGIREELERLCVKLFPKTTPGSKTILIQCRDTGTQGGIYPELNSGIESVKQIAEHVKSIPNKGTETLKLELCGNTQKIADIPDIGEYFKQIPSDKWPSETKRDIEAHFLKTAFEKCYFNMVIGFRSGGLDLFSFLGIPSVSISVRQMVGERRHREIALTTKLRRWNIQYELPRHVTTKYFGDRRDLLGSPWWLFDTTKKPTKEDKKKQKTPPSAFHEYDNEIVRIGIYNAIVVFLDWKHKDIPTIKPNVQNREFSNSIFRPCYFSNIKREQLHAFFFKQQGKEQTDFKIREWDINERNESKDDFAKWKKAMEDDWKKILKKHPVPMFSGQHAWVCGLQ